MVVPLNATPSGNGRPFRFTRQFRLKSPVVIRRILQGGLTMRRQWDTLRVVWAESACPNPLRQPRFAFVVSRHAGPAVTRNRIKRRLREAVRLQRESWPSEPVDVIIRVREHNLDDLSFEDLQAQVRSALIAIKNQA